MVLKRSFGHILKRVMFLRWKLVNQRNKIYHKTYVLLGVQQNLSFQNQPQDYYEHLHFSDPVVKIVHPHVENVIFRGKTNTAIHGPHINGVGSSMAMIILTIMWKITT